MDLNRCNSEVRTLLPFLEHFKAIKKAPFLFKERTACNSNLFEVQAGKVLPSLKQALLFTNNLLKTKTITHRSQRLRVGVQPQN